MVRPVADEGIHGNPDRGSSANRAVPDSPVCLPIFGRAPRAAAAMQANRRSRPRASGLSTEEAIAGCYHPTVVRSEKEGDDR